MKEIPTRVLSEESESSVEVGHASSSGSMPDGTDVLSKGKTEGQKEGPKEAHMTIPHPFGWRGGGGEPSRIQYEDDPAPYEQPIRTACSLLLIFLIVGY